MPPAPFKPNVVRGLLFLGLGLTEVASWCARQPKLVEFLKKLGEAQPEPEPLVKPTPFPPPRVTGIP